MPLWGCAATSNAANRDKTTREWNETLANIERTAQGRLGVAMLDTGSGLQLGWRQDERFAMASTFKAVLAGWMLALVDQGKLLPVLPQVVERGSHPIFAVILSTRHRAPKVLATMDYLQTCFASFAKPSGEPGMLLRPDRG